MTDTERLEMWKVVTEEFLETEFSGQPPKCEDVITKLVTLGVDLTIKRIANGRFATMINYSDTEEQFENLLDALCYAAMYTTVNWREITPTYLTKDTEP